MSVDQLYYYSLVMVQAEADAQRGNEVSSTGQWDGLLPKY